MQPRSQLSFWAVSMHYWLMLSLSSTRTLKSLSTGLQVPEKDSSTIPNELKPKDRGDLLCSTENALGTIISRGRYMYGRWCWLGDGAEPPFTLKAGRNDSCRKGHQLLFIFPTWEVRKIWHFNKKKIVNNNNKIWLCTVAFFRCDFQIKSMTEISLLVVLRQKTPSDPYVVQCNICCWHDITKWSTNKKRIRHTAPPLCYFIRTWQEGYLICQCTYVG